jgi:hypothetical protein
MSPTSTNFSLYNRHHLAHQKLVKQESKILFKLQSFTIILFMIPPIALSQNSPTKYQISVERKTLVRKGMARFLRLLLVLFAFISLCQSIQEETIKEDIRTEHKNIVSLIKQRTSSENG